MSSQEMSKKEKMFPSIELNKNNTENNEQLKKNNNFTFIINKSEESIQKKDYNYKETNINNIKNEPIFESNSFDDIINRLKIINNNNINTLNSNNIKKKLLLLK